MGESVDYVLITAAVSVPLIALFPEALDALYIIARITAALFASPW